MNNKEQIILKFFESFYKLDKGEIFKEGKAVTGRLFSVLGVEYIIDACAEHHDYNALFETVSAIQNGQVSFMDETLHISKFEVNSLAFFINYKALNCRVFMCPICKVCYGVGSLIFKSARIYSYKPYLCALSKLKELTELDKYVMCYCIRVLTIQSKLIEAFKETHPDAYNSVFWSM